MTLGPSETIRRNAELEEEEESLTRGTTNYTGTQKSENKKKDYFTTSHLRSKYIGIILFAWENEYVKHFLGNREKD